MKATKPALVMKLIILSHSSTQIEIKTIRNNITDIFEQQSFGHDEICH